MTEPARSLPTPDLPTLGQVSRRPPAGGARKEWVTATVIGIHDETARMRTYRLRLPGPFAHVPGQYLTLRLTAPDGYSATRSYSIASRPGLGTPQHPEVELMVERLAEGEVSAYLHDELAVGDPLEVRGPFGGWFVWTGKEPAMLLGGGSGVVPLMAMLRHQRAAVPGVPVRLVASVRSPDDLPFSGEYGDESTVVYTRLAPERSPRPAGRLTADDVRAVLLPDAEAYVCGSSSFADHAARLLVDLGVPPERIRMERYGPS